MALREHYEKQPWSEHVGDRTRYHYYYTSGPMTADGDAPAIGTLLTGYTNALDPRVVNVFISPDRRNGTSLVHVIYEKVDGYS